MKSMTGYGMGKSRSENGQATAEIRSVNHRYLDLVLRLPREYIYMEGTLRRLLQERFSRGRVELNVQLDLASGTAEMLRFDSDLAIRYYELLKELSALLDLDQMPKIELIAGLPGVFTLSDEQPASEEGRALIIAAVEEALQQVEVMRREEAAILKTDLVNRLQNCFAIRKEIVERAPQVIAEYRNKLKSRVMELLTNEQELDAALAESKLEAEVVYFADKSDISEELTRLESHFLQLQSLWEVDDTPIGRTADFLIQEANREVNTIGSKANDARIAHAVVLLKAELEKIREQVQNIE